MYVQRIVVPITTDGSGNATVTTPVIDQGFLSQIRYIKDGTNPFTNGVAFACTLVKTGEAIWSESNVNASATRAPRQPTHGTDGTPSLYATGGTPVQDKIAIAQDQIQVVVTGGGATKAGVIEFLIV